MVLLAAEGLPNTEIGRRVGMTRQTVIAWRARYEAGGVEALADLPRSGRPAVIDEPAVIASTLNPPPAELAVTHWSARLLSGHLTKAGTPISFAEVARIWRDWGLQPHRAETFKFSTDPQLEAKIRDVVGLYLDPPANAVVVCVDEKSQIQALDRTAPLLPMRFHQAERRTHDYQRHGTTTLFAALEVATGKITADACYDRHRNTEFLAFLKQVAKAHPRWNCTWWPTTTPPTTTPTSKPGWPATRGSACISPRPARPG
jgi:transposase